MINESAVFADGYKHAMRNGRSEKESIRFFREYCDPFREKAEAYGQDYLDAFDEMITIVERLIHHEYASKESTNEKLTRVLRDFRPVVYAFLAAIVLVGILFYINDYKNNNNETSNLYEHKNEIDQGGNG